MRAPALNKRLLLEAGWIRPQCAEPIAAKCARCGSLIDLTACDPSASEKECWVCAWKEVPTYECLKCACPLREPGAELSAKCSSCGSPINLAACDPDTPQKHCWACSAKEIPTYEETSSSSSGCASTVFEMRECLSVTAYEGNRRAVFKPEGETWFYRTSGSGKIRLTTFDELLELFDAGKLRPTAVVCQEGEPGYVKVAEHPRFSSIFGKAAEHEKAVRPINPEPAAEVTPSTAPFAPGGSPPRPAPTPVPPLPSPAAGQLPFGVWASLGFFLWGFLGTGVERIGGWVPSSWLMIGGFTILAIVSTFCFLKVSAKYLRASLVGGRVPLGYPILTDSLVLQRWLACFSLALMVVFVVGRWESSGGFFRFFAVVAAISFPFLPLSRGALGSYALGYVTGFAAVLAAAIPAGIVSLFAVSETSPSEARDPLAVGTIVERPRPGMLALSEDKKPEEAFVAGALTDRPSASFPRISLESDEGIIGSEDISERKPDPGDRGATIGRSGSSRAGRDDSPGNPAVSTVSARRLFEPRLWRDRYGHSVEGRLRFVLDSEGRATPTLGIDISRISSGGWTVHLEKTDGDVISVSAENLSEEALLFLTRGE
jgi:hypothetical protein